VSARARGGGGGGGGGEGLSAHAETASRFGVRGYPTLKLLHKGQVFDFKGKR
jgi:hypothetical protein